LKEQNFHLKREIDHCHQTHRPRTAPSQPPSRPHQPIPERPRLSVNTTTHTASTSKPLSAFNASVDLSNTGYYSPELFLPPTQTIFLPSHDIAPNSSGFRNTFRSSHRPPPLPINAGVRASGISSPIVGSVVKHEVTFNGIPLSSTTPMRPISLSEARRRAKPLPPLGPMSPSIVPGLVEIEDVSQNYDFESRGRLKKGRGLSKLFKKGQRG